MIRTRRNPPKLYMVVSEDDFQLPLFVSEDVKEIARFCGIEPNTVHTSLCHQRKGRTRFCRYVEVYFSEEEMDEIIGG